MDAYVWCQTTGIGCGGATDTSPSSAWPHKHSQMGFQWRMRIYQAVDPDHLRSESALVPPQTRPLKGAVWPCHIRQLAGTHVLSGIQRVVWSGLRSSIHTDGQLPEEPESPPEPLTWSEEINQNKACTERVCVRGNLYARIASRNQILMEFYWNFYHNFESFHFSMHRVQERSTTFNK